MIIPTATFIVRFIEVVRHSEAMSLKRENFDAADMLSMIAGKLEKGQFKMASAMSLFALTVIDIGRARKAKDYVIDRLGSDLFTDCPDVLMNEIVDHVFKGSANGKGEVA